MRTMVRSMFAMAILLALWLLATPLAQSGQIISKTSQGWLVGSASDGAAVTLGSDGVGYLKVAPGGLISTVNGSRLSGGFTRNSLGTTRQTGFYTDNTTAAAAGAQQISPSIDWVGQGWKSNATTASREVRFYSYVLPIQAAGNPSGTWKLGVSVNGGVDSDLMEVGYISGGNGLLGVNLPAGKLYYTSGGQLNASYYQAGSGSAYALTNAAAAIEFSGGNNPAITLVQAGTYRICGQVQLAYNGATVAAQTATLVFHRTNNTPVDISDAVVLDLPVATTLTHTYGIFSLPCLDYATNNTDDALTIYANVSANLSAGTIDATGTGTAISAVRLY